jgi:hypothetical protein
MAITEDTLIRGAARCGEEWRGEERRGEAELAHSSRVTKALTDE